jgi:O-antigen/teichoic acid export membrane protein
MTSELDTGSVGDRRRTHLYAREFGAAMAGYAVVLVLAIAVGGLDGTSPWRFAWALAPVVPVLFMVRAVYRHVRRVDEYQRGLLLQGFAVGFAVMCATAITLGLLEAAGLAFEGSAWVVYAAGMVSWGIASGIASRQGC